MFRVAAGGTGEFSAGMLTGRGVRANTIGILGSGRTRRSGIHGQVGNLLKVYVVGGPGAWRRRGRNSIFWGRAIRRGRSLRYNPHRRGLAEALSKSGTAILPCRSHLRETSSPRC